MRASILSLFVLCSFASSAQLVRDTVLSRCPVYITDTVSNYNYFITARPVTLKVYRTKGDLTVVVEQRNQFFTLFFNVKKLKETKYAVSAFPRNGNEMMARYSFKEDNLVSYADMTSGQVEIVRDKEKGYWWVKVNGFITNWVGSSTSKFKVKAELPLK